MLASAPLSAMGPQSLPKPATTHTSAAPKCALDVEPRHQLDHGPSSGPSRQHRRYGSPRSMHQVKTTERALRRH